MDTKQLRTLYAEFCRAMLEWVQAGMPNENPHNFYGGVGLCSNLRDYAPLEHIAALDAYQMALFNDAGLDPCFPFDGDYDVYRDSKYGTGLYTNEHRLQWLRDHAEVL